MKNIITRIIRLTMICCCLIVTLYSCEYREIADADYPEQRIYLPAAVRGIYIIDGLSQLPEHHPTPGAAHRFLVDLENRRFNVPLAVYRSGVDNKGSFSVDIMANTDTINNLIAQDMLHGAELLSSANYTLQSSVIVQDGDEIAPFLLSIDMDFLRNNAPDQKYAIGVSISSSEREHNPDISTAVILVDTRIMVPRASFTYRVDDYPRRIHFTNTSTYEIADYSWDFGDGNTSTDKSPSNTYNTGGTYTVSLTVTGITGEKVTETVDLIII